MKKAFVIAALAAFGLPASSAAFTFERNRLETGIMPVYSMPKGDLGELTENGPALGASVEYLLLDNIKAGLDLGYARYGAGGRIKAIARNYAVTVFNVGPVAKYVITRDRLAYYAAAGLGLYSWAEDRISGIAAAEAGTDLGISIGAGAGYKFRGNWTGGLELRYHAVGGGLNSDILNFGVKLDYKF